ncbi:hypothetical protein HYN49_07295 [Flavobacterium pallidum]|uniref:KTSC domain-containing protein n=2 Tax=Flavobacterium pallidum TaxID=2172098 RepID=A0A2S1SH73_9FLAO|nr:hypothetical protein HYN49_07295 [Flavobacterium pallidum]
MKPYANKSGYGGIWAYDFDENGIAIMFDDGSTYYYNSKSTGKANIEIMKRLAGNGIGLITFINQHMRGNYNEKRS